jgi:hypothetical protein
MNNGNGATAKAGEAAAGTTGTTAAQARERLGEILFNIATFFGGLHFASLLGQIAIMYTHTALGRELDFPLKASMFMGNIYLGFLTLYVGRKEYLRWQRAPEDEVLPQYVLVKLTRGEVIIVAWALLTGIAAMLWQMSYINEVPQPLIWTLGEVVALWCGTEAIKYFKNAITASENRQAAESFGDKAVDYAKAKGRITNNDCKLEFGVTDQQAYRLLKQLVKDKQLREKGDNKGRWYEPL